MEKNITFEILQYLIPENRMTSVLDVSSMFDAMFDMNVAIRKLNEISQGIFGMRFIQSEYCADVEISQIEFKEQTYYLSRKHSDEFDIKEILWQLNKWCPENFLFDFTTIGNLKIVVFLDKLLDTKLATLNYKKYFYFSNLHF